jgi:hypothetical protein
MIARGAAGLAGCNLELFTDQLAAGKTGRATQA